MNEKTLPRWRIVTLITTTIAFLFAVTYALTGYIVFGQQTQGIFFLIIKISLFQYFPLFNKIIKKVIFWKIIVIGIHLLI